MDNFYRKKSLLILSLFFPMALFCFKPAPPPGTPRLCVRPVIEIEYVSIDCFVMDTTAQVVMMASFRFADKCDTAIISAEWGIDSADVYVETGSEKNIVGKLSAGMPLIFYVSEKDVILRVSYETNIHRALSGPPGKWIWGRIFELNYPFIKTDNSVLPIKAFKARLIFPSELEPEDCAGLFSIDTLRGDLVVRQITDASKINRGCKFKAIDK